MSLMKARSHCTGLLIGAALLAPALAMANAEWHQENTDQGLSYHPEHAQSTSTRAQVQADARSAAPGLIVREGPPLDTFPAATQTKTREQVRHERLSQSPEEKQRLQWTTQGS
ncbi:MULTISPECIES: DUF4148 domain-containing protein [Azohydromonas]|jgi:hypothetical protein|uniref:DUF4148 domain-containing protein n=1 Tax=Azohydromonas lata TaxID=45677 RepID=A0ABU5I9B2_9BURK|nr:MULTISPECIES: DUF4148 domain-containing protein [Azohydromonas]MDZ5455697.1 DUF4148 domain-containing protein [Azohydromonas lata]